MAKKKPKKLQKAYDSRRLTQHLRELAAEIDTIDEGGELLTKGQVLAKLVFDKALGYEEKRKDDEGKEETIYHKPEAWAITLIWERMEGRAPQAVPDDKKTLTATVKINELAKQRINSLSDAALAIPGLPGGLDVSDHEDQGPEGPDQKSGMASEASGSG